MSKCACLCGSERSRGREFTFSTAGIQTSAAAFSFFNANSSHMIYFHQTVRTCLLRCSTVRPLGVILAHTHTHTFVELKHPPCYQIRSSITLLGPLTTSVLRCSLIRSHHISCAKIRGETNETGRSHSVRRGSFTALNRRIPRHSSLHVKGLVRHLD